MASKRTVKSCLAKIKRLEHKNNILQLRLDTEVAVHKNTQRMFNLMEDGYDGLVVRWDDLVERIRNIHNHEEG
jgi:hypothetical protein